MMKKNKIILTRKETAHLLSVSLATLRVWTVKGLIKAYQLGGRVYYKQDEIIRSMKRIK